MMATSSGETRTPGGTPRAWLGIGLTCLALTCTTRVRAEDGVTANDSDRSRWPVVDVLVARATGLPTLEARSVNGWQRTSCVPPCTLRLNPLGDYRISGQAVVDSDPFRLPLDAERVRLDVSVGSTLVRDLGTAFAIGGLLFATGGGTILLLPQDDHASSDARTDKTVVGVGFLTMGVLTTALGMVLRLVSDTTVRISPDDAARSMVGAR